MLQFCCKFTSVSVCQKLWGTVVCVYTESRDYCLHETFNATCRPGTVLLMTSAVYGRMRIGRCIDGDFNIGCATDVLRYFDRQCTARRSCDVDVRNLVDLHPCQRDFMSYLEASYRCVQGMTIDLSIYRCRLRAASKFPLIPTGTKKYQSFLSYALAHSLSDLIISSPNRYDCILLIIVLYYCVLFFYYCIFFHISLASWLLFSNKVQFSIYLRGVSW